MSLCPMVIFTVVQTTNLIVRFSGSYFELFLIFGDYSLFTQNYDLFIAYKASLEVVWS